MPIKNLSDVRRLPRLGKIHLGIKVKSDKTGNEYPKEVSYFVCPPQVEEVFGEKPTDLNIMFPVESPDVFFQQWYKSYGYNLLKCKGDGQKALTWDEEKGGMKEIDCPCEKLDKGDCKRIGLLQFLLPDVPGAGVWQITTSSRNSIIDINSSIDYIKSICGRIRMIPLVLKRVETKVQRIENGQPKKGTHYTLQIDVDNISLRQLQQAAQVAPERVMLPSPDEDKDDLLYPENGFKPEEEKKEEGPEKPEKEMNESKEIEDLKIKIAHVCAEYETHVKKLTKAETNRINELKTVDEYINAIDHFKSKLPETQEEMF